MGFQGGRFAQTSESAFCVLQESTRELRIRSNQEIIRTFCVREFAFLLHLLPRDSEGAILCNAHPPSGSIYAPPPCARESEREQEQDKMAPSDGDNDATL